jgi:hypothetical protein
VSDSTTLEETPTGTEAPPTEAPAAGAPSESAWAGPDEAPTAPPTAPADVAPPAPPVEPPAPVPAAPAAKPARRSVQMPMWLLAILGVAVLVVGAFFVGRATAPDSSSSGPSTLAEAVEQTARGDMPVGDFDFQDLIAALRQNGNLNFNLGDILDQLGGR